MAIYDENLAAEFFAKQWAEDLLGEFFVKQGSENLPAEFESGQNSEELFGEFESQTSVELHGAFEGQISVDLLGKFIVRHDSYADLLGGFDGQDTENLPAVFKAQATVDLFGEFIPRRSAWVRLSGEFIVQHAAFSSEPFGKFIIRHAGFADLLGEFIVRHTASPLSLFAKFASRIPYPYWTNRALVNGVIAAAEALIGDAPFEFVMEGVMDDIKVWSDANEVSYATWTDLDSAPIAIKRATTYGVVAALYARHTQTFQGRVVPTLAPVTVTVVGDEEKAMQHWTSKMDEMLELYLSAQGADRLWVSTADEEPIFSMADIPETGDDRELQEWHDWLEG